MSRWLFGNSNLQHPGNVSSFTPQIRIQFEPVPGPPSVALEYQQASQELPENGLR